MKKDKIRKKIEKLKKDPEYIFTMWAKDKGWEAELGQNVTWTNGKDKLSLDQLRKVFEDYKEMHGDSD